MPEPAATRGWKIWSAVIVFAVAASICWIVEKRSQPPPPPPVTLPYPDKP